MNAAAQTNPVVHEVYISLGSNIEPETNLPLAVRLLGEHGQVKAASNVWESPPVGTSGPNFLNAVILYLTDLPADELKLKVLRAIESRLGRVRTEDKNAPRQIDLDITVYDNDLLDEELWLQTHLAVPFAEIYPGYTHPTRGETIGEIALKFQKTNPIELKPGITIFKT